MEILRNNSALRHAETQALDVLHEAGLGFADLVGQIPNDGWSMPTPCPGWDVRTLVVHTASIIENLVPFANGNDLPPAIEPGELRNSRQSAERVRIAVQRGVAAWTPRSLRQVQRFPWGNTPGSRAVEFTTVEVVVHGWDLAQALGRPFEIANDVIEATSVIAAAYLDAARWPGLFDPPLTPNVGASAVEVLAAQLGRGPFSPGEAS